MFIVCVWGVYILRGVYVSHAGVLRVFTRVAALVSVCKVVVAFLRLWCVFRWIHVVQVGM